MEGGCLRVIVLLLSKQTGVIILSSNFYILRYYLNLALITYTGTVAAKQGTILSETSHSLFYPNLKQLN